MAGARNICRAYYDKCTLFAPSRCQRAHASRERRAKVPKMVPPSCDVKSGPLARSGMKAKDLTPSRASPLRFGDLRHGWQRGHMMIGVGGSKECDGCSAALSKCMSVSKFARFCHDLARLGSCDQEGPIVPWGVTEGISWSVWRLEVRVEIRQSVSLV